MAISLSSISKGKALLAPRIALLGAEGVGKSTWAKDSPGPIFLPMAKETGLDEIDAPKFPPAKSYEDVMNTLQCLIDEDHDYKTVVIDSASAFEPLVWDYTCRTNPKDGATPSHIEKVEGGFHKGYTICLGPWSDFLGLLDELRENKGMGSILIGHVAVKTFNDPLADPYDQYIFDLHKLAAGLIIKWADCVFFASRKTYTKSANVGEQKKGKGNYEPAAKVTHATGGVERYLYTDKRPAHPGKSRFPLPYELPFTYAAFQAAMNASRAA